MALSLKSKKPKPHCEYGWSILRRRSSKKWIAQHLVNLGTMSEGTMLIFWDQQSAERYLKSYPAEGSKVVRVKVAISAKE